MADEKLEEMFRMQEISQKEYGAKMDIEYVRVMTLALTDEIFESLRETQWKPWKKNHINNQDAAKDELVDAMHFFINLCLAHGMTAHELFMRFKHKNELNKTRRETGY